MNSQTMSMKMRRAILAALLAVATLAGVEASRARAATLTFAVGATNAVTNSQVIVPIRVTNFTGISSFQFSLHWSPAVATFVGVEQFGLPGLTASNFGMTLLASGTLTTAWDDPDGATKSLADGSMVFGVRLQFVGPAAATCPVTIDGIPTAVVAGDENLNSVPVSIVDSILSIDRTLLVTCASAKVVECGTPWGFDLPVATDSCGGQPVTINILSTVTNMTGTCGFTATRTWEILDPCTNRTVCVQTVTAIDTTPPVVICAPDKTIEYGQAWAFDVPSGNDSCVGTNVNIRVTSTVTNPGPCGLMFTATRMWEVADGCSNAVSCTQVVMVRDTTAPTITCQPNKNINCLGAWSFDAPSATDIADGTGVLIEIVGTVTNGSCGASFSATRTWRATDSCGNSSTCSQTAFGRAIVAVTGKMFLPTNYPPTLTDKRVATATILGPTNTTATTAADGSYNLVFDAANNVLLNTVPPTNGNPSDGVTTLDITLLRRHILNISLLDSPYKLLAGDVDGSSVISTLDLSFMRRLILGVTNKFPKGLWRFAPADYAFTNMLAPWASPTNRTYSSVGADVGGQDFVAIKLGDVNNSWTPPAGAAAPAKQAPAKAGGNNTTNGVTFVLPMTNSLPGNDVVVPVLASQFNNVGTFQFSLHWNPATVTFIVVEQMGLIGLGVGNFNLAMSNSGTMAISWDDPFAGTQNLPEGTQIFAVRFRASGSPSNTTSLTIDGSPIPFEVTDGFTPVTASAIDGSIYIDQPNRAPVIAAIGDQSVTEGATLSFTAAVTDADGPQQTQTFSLDAGAPAGATINPLTGLFSWTPTEAQGPGVYPVTVRVTDDGLPAPLSGTNLFSITVNETNAAPQLAAIGNRLGNEGGLITFTAGATDADLPVQLLTFTLDPGAPAGASITTGGLFTWTPTEDQGPSTNSITVRVTDNGTPARSATETIVVTIGEANGAPMLTTIGSRSVNESNTLTFTAIGADTDMPSQTLSYSLSNAPAGATINPSSGQFSWTPTEAQGPGSYLVTVLVTDNGTPALSDAEIVTISVGEVNLAPTLNPIANQTVNELSPLAFTAVGADVDAPANALVYSLSNAPAGATINASSGAFAWTPTEAQGSNTYSFFVRVTDNGTPALSAVQPVTVTVNEVTSAPVLAAIGDKAVNEGSLLTFTNTATDADLPAQILTYSLSNAPAGASINASNGVFTWTPTEGQGPASYTVTVLVTDDGVPSQIDSETITITVSEVAAAPVLALIGSKAVNEGAALNFTATATDGDLPAQTLTYSLSNAPAGATISSSSGLFTWTPTEAQGPGTYLVTVIVSDGAQTDSEVVSINVSEVPTPPVLAAIGNKSVNEGVLLTFNAAATDADLPAQTLMFTLEGAPVGASISSGGVFTFTPSEAQGPSNYVMTVRVTDSTGQNVSESITVTVNEANIAPTLAVITDKTVVKNTLLTFATAASDVDLPAQTLTFSLEPGAPAGAAIHPTTGVFSWTPNSGQGPGTNSITVRVTDNGPGALSATRTFTVSVSNGNTPPVLAAIGPKQVTTQTELTFTAVATDVESSSQTLTFSLINALAGASIHPITGLFTWTPTDEQAPSTNLVTVRVTDNALNPASDEETIQIVVLEHFPPDISVSDTIVPGGTDGTLTAEFEVTLAAPSARTVTVEFTTDDGSGLAGTDYVHTSGLLTFAPGVTNLTVDVQVFGKSTVYTDRTFFVYLFNATNGVVADGEGQGTLDSNPAPGLYISDTQLVEGNSGRSNAVFTVSLIGPHAQKVTASYTAAKQSASLRRDFSPKRGKLTFLPGTTTQTISVPVVGELLSESNEVFLVNLSRPVGAVIIQGQGRATILDDDVTPEVSVADVSTTESDTGVRGLAFTLRLSARSGRSISVDFGTSDGTAVGGADYLPTNGTVIIPPGLSSRKITVPILGNRTSESNEMFFLNLGNPVNARLGRAQAVGNVRDNDRAPSVSISDAQVFPGMSGGRFALFTVRLSAPSARAISATVATARDSAVAGTDYVAVNEVVNFAPGEAAKTVVVELIDNPAVTGKRFYLALISAVNAVTGDKLGVCVIPAP